MSFDETNVRDLIEAVGAFVADHEALREKISKLNADSGFSDEYKKARVEAMTDEFREAHAGAMQAISDAERRFQADVDAYTNGVDLDSDYMAALSRTVGMFGAKTPDDVVQTLLAKATHPWEARMAQAAFENAGIKRGPALAATRAQVLTPTQPGSFASRAYIAAKHPGTEPLQGDFMHWRDGIRDAVGLMEYGPDGNPNADAGQGGGYGTSAE